MERKMCWLEFHTLKESEKIIRKFLLERCNIVRLTAVQGIESGPLGDREFGGARDKKFSETLKNLEPDFIKRVTNDKQFNDIVQLPGQKFTHYFYTLSPKMKSFLNKESLVWYCYCPDSTNFYCLEDPTFYKKDLMIGSVITHENMVSLYLTSSEKQGLKKKGATIE